MHPHQIVRYVVGLHLFQLVHGHRGQRPGVGPPIPLAAPQQGRYLPQQGFALQHAGILLHQHQAALVPAALGQIPEPPGGDLVRIQGIGQGPVRQQLILYLLALLLPLRLGDLLLQLQQAAHQAGPPLLHEQLTQPLGRLHHDLAHQAAGIPGEGAVLLQRLQQGRQPPHQLGQGQQSVGLIEQVLLLQRHRHRLVAHLLAELLAPGLDAFFQQLALQRGAFEEFGDLGGGRQQQRHLPRQLPLTYEEPQIHHADL
ncbi:hypothetical protein D3C75_397490 [compost metagenome]